MDVLNQKPSDCTPKVVFNPNGNLLIKGRSYSEYPQTHFDPLVTFCNKLRAKEVIFDVHMDYLNTASSKCLFSVIAAIEDNDRIRRAEVRWHYEDDDEEMLEMGEIFTDMCEKVKFEMLPEEMFEMSFTD